jgi:hypothetical protein
MQVCDKADCKHEHHHHGEDVRLLAALVVVLGALSHAELLFVFAQVHDNTIATFVLEDRPGHAGENWCKTNI